MTELFRRDWPIEDPKSTVVIIHGLAEHSGRYQHVAEALNAAGYKVAAIDVAGHGNSPGFPGELPPGGLDETIADISGFIRETAETDGPVHVLAHSMGTLLTLPAMLEVPTENVRSLVLSGTATHPGEATMESLTAGGPIPPEEVSTDAAMVEAYKTDPLVFYDRVPMDLTMLAAEAIGRANEAVPGIAVPTYVFHGLEDRIVSADGSREVWNNLVVVDKQIRLYEGMLHETLNETNRAEVIRDLIEWLDAHNDITTD